MTPLNQQCTISVNTTAYLLVQYVLDFFTSLPTSSANIYRSMTYYTNSSVYSPIIGEYISEFCSYSSIMTVVPRIYSFYVGVFEYQGCIFSFCSGKKYNNVAWFHIMFLGKDIPVVCDIFPFYDR